MHLLHTIVHNLLAYSAIQSCSKREARMQAELDAWLREHKTRNAQ